MRRKQRSIYYTCSAIKDNNLISVQVEAGNKKIAIAIFQKQYRAEPQVVLGPFYIKQHSNDPKPPKPIIEPKLKKIPQRHSIKISSLNTNRGTYEGWDINYIPTKEEPDKAYVLFNGRIDKIKMPKPNTKVVDIKDIIPK